MDNKNMDLLNTTHSSRTVKMKEGCSSQKKKELKEIKKYLE
jgi:hypothetical protein